MNRVAQNFVASGKPTYIVANAGVRYTDISNGNVYEQTSIPFGSNWVIKLQGQVFVPTGGGGTVTDVTASAPLVSTGGATPNISIPAASSSADGYLKATDWVVFDGKGNGTVTSVAALTLGTAGTDVSSSVANGTTTPVITLNIPTASASNRGALNSTDWSTFNNKQAAITLTTTGSSGAATFVGNVLNIPQYTGGSGTVTSVSVVTAAGVGGSVANATTTPAITITLGNISPVSVAAVGNVTGLNLSGTNTGDETTASIKTKLGAASGISDGYLTSSDFVAFSGKLSPNPPILSGTATLITWDSNGFVLGGTTATTADVTDTTNLRYVTDADLVTLSSTSGTNTGDETTATIKAKLGAASAIQDGYLTMADWATFNSKVGAARTINTTAPLTGGGDLSADRTIAMPAATGAVDGYLTAANWTTFNSKEPAITQLPINKGGTNSVAALSNNRVMISSGSAIVEATAITAARALISDANGIPVHSAVTSTELGYVSGVTSALQTQLNNKIDYADYRRSTRYYLLPAITAGSTTLITHAQVANTVYYVPFVVTKAFSIDLFQINVTATGTASGTRLGIYNADSNFEPSTLVIDGGAVVTSGTGFKTAAIANTLLSPGLYFTAMVSNGTCTINGIIVTAAGQIIGNAASTINGAVGYSATLAYGAFPGTASGALTIVSAAMGGLMARVV